MADTFLGFKYRGKTLNLNNNPDFNGFIKNEDLALELSSAPSFSNSTVNPLHGEHSIFTGVTKDSRVFNLDIILNSISLADYRLFLDWVNLDDSGWLEFDYNPGYYYKVKVEDLSGVRFYKVGNDIYNIELQITFATTEDWAAYELDPVTESYYQFDFATNSYVYNLFDLSITVNALSEDKFTITNKSKLDLYFELDFEGVGLNTQVEKSLPLPIAKIFVSNNFNGCTYYSKYGIAIDPNKNFLPGEINKAIVKPGEVIEYISVLDRPQFIRIIARERI